WGRANRPARGGAAHQPRCGAGRCPRVRRIRRRPRRRCHPPAARSHSCTWRECTRRVPGAGRCRNPPDLPERNALAHCAVVAGQGCAPPLRQCRRRHGRVGRQRFADRPQREGAMTAAEADRADIARWDARYGTDDYVFGTEPNAFLASQAHRLMPGMSVLAVADGEGRNGVWLAAQGMNVLSVDASETGLEKARKLAAARGVRIATERVDLGEWNWGAERFDAVVAIFVQFADPALREAMFAGMQRTLKPGGLLLLQGYRPEQLEYGAGGPSDVDKLYTGDLLRDAFAGMELLY